MNRNYNIRFLVEADEYERYSSAAAISGADADIPSFLLSKYPTFEALDANFSNLPYGAGMAIPDWPVFILGELVTGIGFDSSKQTATINTSSSSYTISYAKATG